MFRILPSSPVDMPRSRRLSGRSVRKVVLIGQRWCDSDKREWRVMQVYRADRLVLLQSPGWHALYRVTFDELGRHYELMEREGS